MKDGIVMAVIGILLAALCWHKPGPEDWLFIPVAWFFIGFGASVALHSLRYQRFK